MRVVLSSFFCLLVACDYTPLLRCDSPEVGCPDEATVAHVIDAVEDVSGTDLDPQLMIVWQARSERHPQLAGISYRAQSTIFVNDGWDLQHTALVHELVHQVAFVRAIRLGDDGHKHTDLWLPNPESIESLVESKLFGGQ